MKVKIFAIASFLTIGSVLFISCGQKKQQISDKVPVRIGWQIPLATQGQVVQVLKRTTLLEQHGLDAKFVSFSYGGPQSEAALAQTPEFLGPKSAWSSLARPPRRPSTSSGMLSSDTSSRARMPTRYPLSTNSTA